MLNSNLQNAQYTFKYNTSMGRHGWLRLTPAYSVRMVEEILNGLDYEPQCVLEPFSGTGTTELVCANRGINSFALEINPFLVWLGDVKTTSYTEHEIIDFKRAANDIISCIDYTEPAALPPMYNIERWWGNAQLDFLARLKSAIWEIDNLAVKNLLKIAFCRVIIELSNAAFNHVSTSFKDEQETCYEEECGKEYFLSACNMVIQTITNQPKVQPVIYHFDSKKIPSAITALYDTVITSPPYPNRISYIRELRPYMYWLDFLSTAEQASDMDWNTIGGTWGSATSKLATWENSSFQLPDYLYSVITNISKADNKSAQLMAKYVHKYFEDMAIHLSSVYAGLTDGGQINYIVGNSNFYGVTVPSEKIYADIMTEIGFRDAKYRIVRKRNCNKCLYEYIITAKK